MPKATSSSPENTIEATVTIRCPVEKVFAFYRDFQNRPTFLGDVMAVEPIDAATSRWTIQGPFGIRAYWMIRVTEVSINELIRYETVTPPVLRTCWEIHFAPTSKARATEVVKSCRRLSAGWGARLLP